MNILSPFAMEKLYSKRWIIYRKFPKYSETQKNCCSYSKIWTVWLFHRVMSQNDAEGIASSLIWVCTVCPGIFVRKLKIITVYTLNLLWLSAEESIAVGVKKFSLPV